MGREAGGSLGGTYLDLARLGKNAWWRYVLSVVIVVYSWVALAGVLTTTLGFLARHDGDPRTYLDVGTVKMLGFDPVLEYAFLNLSIAVQIVGVYVAVRFVHRRPFLTLIGSMDRVRWGRAAQSFGLFFALVAVQGAVGYLIDPTAYRLAFDPLRLLVLLPIVLLLTPLQTSAEEVLHRGYLLQSFGLLTRKPYLLCAGSGLLFVLPHLINPDIPDDTVGFFVSVAYYCWFGSLMALVTLKDDGLELALGAHAANNLFIDILVDSPGSGTAQIAVFSLVVEDAGKTGVWDVAFLLGTITFISVAFYAVLFRHRRRTLGEKT